ncbi:MAG: hypothetical protein Q8K36_02270, partial [Alphaproteobacteria bacterium]|nr:hypothetical protein [Alphaproteobacteria bacterium]
ILISTLITTGSIASEITLGFDVNRSFRHPKTLRAETTECVPWRMQSSERVVKDTTNQEQPNGRVQVDRFVSFPLPKPLTADHPEFQENPKNIAMKAFKGLWEETFTTTLGVIKHAPNCVTINESKEWSFTLRLRAPSGLPLEIKYCLCVDMSKSEFIAILKAVGIYK